jgi:hypothetical protein
MKSFHNLKQHYKVNANALNELSIVIRQVDELLIHEECVLLKYPASINEVGLIGSWPYVPLVIDRDSQEFDWDSYPGLLGKLFVGLSISLLGNIGGKAIWRLTVFIGIDGIDNREYNLRCHSLEGINVRKIADDVVMAAVTIGKFNKFLTDIKSEYRYVALKLLFNFNWTL